MRSFLVDSDCTIPQQILKKIIIKKVPKDVCFAHLTFARATPMNGMAPCSIN